MLCVCVCADLKGAIEVLPTSQIASNGAELTIVCRTPTPHLPLTHTHTHPYTPTHTHPSPPHTHSYIPTHPHSHPPTHQIGQHGPCVAIDSTNTRRCIDVGRFIAPSVLPDISHGASHTRRRGHTPQRTRRVDVEEGGGARGADRGKAAMVHACPWETHGSCQARIRRECGRGTKGIYCLFAAL